MQLFIAKCLMLLTIRDQLEVGLADYMVARMVSLSRRCVSTVEWFCTHGLSLTAMSIKE